ncbi:MAG: hypothetical protein ACREE6_09380 [Limisphaerales bacterium]
MASAMILPITVARPPLTTMPDFRHTYLERGANNLAPQLGPFIILHSVVEHFFQAMFRRLAHVHAKQIVGFARQFFRSWPATCSGLP